MPQSVNTAAAASHEVANCQHNDSMTRTPVTT